MWLPDDTSATGLNLSSNVITLAAGVKATISLCTDCHTNPPVDSATRNAATGLFRGSHNKHAGSLGLACTVCHSNNTTTGHRTGYISMASPSIYGGTYSKASAPTYSFPQSSNPTMGTCNNVSCHTTVQGANGVGAGANAPQTWAAPGPLGCGACHPDMSGASATGRHVKHTNSTAGNYNMACSTCHTGYTSASANPATHGDGTINVALATGTYSGGTISGNNAPGGGYGTCSNVSCHSTAQSATGGLPATYMTPTWGGSGSLGCGGCHVDMKNNVAATGSHRMHAQTANITCDLCHGTGYTSTTVAVATHANGSINLSFTGNAASTNYSQGLISAPGNTYGNCTTSNCHGAGTQVWGADTTDAECTKCHGSPGTAVATYNTDSRTAAPGYIRTGTTITGVDTSGSFGTIVNQVSNDAQVGAHNAHLNSSVRNISGPIACNNCHTVPATIDPTGADGHFTAAPAEVKFGGLATLNSATTATYTGATCNNTYCHFGKSFGGYSPAVTNASVSWTNQAYLNGTTADCQKCHLSPPSATGTHAGVNFPADCNGCHSHVSTLRTYH